MQGNRSVSLVIASPALRDVAIHLDGVDCFLLRQGFGGLVGALHLAMTEPDAGSTPEVTPLFDLKGRTH